MEIPETKDVVANRVSTMEVDKIKPTVQSPMEIISQAVARGAGEKELAIIERMFEFDLKVKAQTAKEAYNEAMAEWKANAPHILKNKEVSYSTSKGQTAYKHATLGNVADTINSSMSPFGLHASWRTDQPNGKITVTCTVSHKLGHSESTQLTADSDNSGSKNPIQALGSTITYLERYTLLALTGLATHDQDTDGLPPESTEPISDDQFATLNVLIEEVGANKKAFCKYLKVDDLDHLPASKYGFAVKALEKKRAK